MTLYMPLFRSCSTLRSLTQLHAHLLVTGLHFSPQASTKLIESYAQLGNLRYAQNVFACYPNPDSFMWGVLVKCLEWNASYKEAISLYNKMVNHAVEVSGYVFPSVLRACAGIDDLRIGEVVHGSAVKRGFEKDDDVVETALMAMYGELGSVGSARKVFVEMSVRDVFSWSSMILIHVQNGEAGEGLDLFREMILDHVKGDCVTMLGVAEATGDLGCLDLARSVHAYTLRQELASVNGSLENSLLLMYVKCGDLSSVEKLFQSLPNRSLSSWTLMISCYNQYGFHERSLDTFVKMYESRVDPSSLTMASLIASCAALCLLREGKSAHCYILRKAIDPKFEFIGPALLDLYVACGRAKYSKNIFGRIQEKTIILWNMFLSVHGRQGLIKEASVIYKEMQMNGFSPDSFTLSILLSACEKSVSSKLGFQIHCHVLKIGDTDEYVHNSLIDMYSQVRMVDSAKMIFEQYQGKSVVTWNSMMCCLLRNGNSAETMNLFKHMYNNRLEMSQVTILTAIQACSNLEDLQKGKWLHHKVMICSMRNMYIDTALTDMYAKCGEIKMARRVFDSMKAKSVASWSAMIAGYGAHGHVNEMISFFNRMVESGIRPNEVVFLNILSGCSHGGYVEKGKMYFNSMIQYYGIEPKNEHFSCMVDLLSRAGDLDGAYRIIKSMKFPADVSTWGSLLNGCRVHQRIDVIRSIEQDLVNLPSKDSGYYMLLSNIHAEYEDWEESQRLRLLMDNVGLKKVPGYSTIKN